MLCAEIHLALANGVQLDIAPDKVSAMSVPAGGATALLCANVDPNVVQLLGRWKSDAMIRHLHVSAQPLIGKHATHTFQTGNFTFEPGNQLPPDFAVHMARGRFHLLHSFFFSHPPALMAMGRAGKPCTRMDGVGQSFSL